MKDKIIGDCSLDMMIIIIIYYYSIYYYYFFIFIHKFMAISVANVYLLFNERDLLNKIHMINCKGLFMYSNWIKINAENMKFADISTHNQLLNLSQIYFFMQVKKIFFFFFFDKVISWKNLFTVTFLYWSLF
jgi:hypothetical protein